MVIKKDGGLIDLAALDPAVAATISQGQKRLGEARLPREERKRVRRERAKSEARRGRRALYDLPEELIARVKELADQHHTTASQVAMLGLSLFVMSVDKGIIRIEDHRIPLANPKYQYLLVPQKAAGRRAGDTPEFQAENAAMNTVANNVYPQEKSGDTARVKNQANLDAQKSKMADDEGEA